MPIPGEPVVFGRNYKANCSSSFCGPGDQVVPGMRPVSEPISELRESLSRPGRGLPPGVLFGEDDRGGRGGPLPPGALGRLGAPGLLRKGAGLALWQGLVFHISLEWWIFSQMEGQEAEVAKLKAKQGVMQRAEEAIPEEELSNILDSLINNAVSNAISEYGGLAAVMNAMEEFKTCKREWEALLGTLRPEAGDPPETMKQWERLRDAAAA